MLTTCVINFKGNSNDNLTLIEFFYNNIYHYSIRMSPFEELHGRSCRSPISWFEVGKMDLIGPELVHETMEKFQLIRYRLNDLE